MQSSAVEIVLHNFLIECNEWSLSFITWELRLKEQMELMIEEKGISNSFFLPYKLDKVVLH